MKMNHHSSSATVSHADHTDLIANTYRFLALTMRYPEPASYSPDFFALCLQLLAHTGMDQEKLALARWLETEHPARIDELRQEYTRLFINGVPTVVAPPFASVYMDEGSLQSRTTERTRDWYRSKGYDIIDPAVPADFICYELEFLSELARAGCWSEEAEFLRTLFRPWFVQFQQRVLEESGHPFYRMSMRLIDFFTKEEQ